MDLRDEESIREVPTFSRKMTQSWLVKKLIVVKISYVKFLLQAKHYRIMPIFKCIFTFTWPKIWRRWWNRSKRWIIKISFWSESIWWDLWASLHHGRNEVWDNHTTKVSFRSNIGFELFGTIYAWCRFESTKNWCKELKWKTQFGQTHRNSYQFT